MSTTVDHSGDDSQVADLQLQRTCPTTTDAADQLVTGRPSAYSVVQCTAQHISKPLERTPIIPAHF
jgi:hypothetical protein